MAETSVVRLRVSASLLLNQLLHLPEAELVAASSEILRGSEETWAVSFFLRYPGVPPGADEMVPTYTRHENGDVELTGIEWYAAGKGLVLAEDAAGD